MNDLYKSPIEMMMSKAVYEAQAQHEKHILRAVLNVGINVDKEELIKALQYDRGQYDKGYADGVREFAKMLMEKAQCKVFCDDRLLKTRWEYYCIEKDDIYRIVEELAGKQNE